MRFRSNYNSPSKLEGVPVGGGRVSKYSSRSQILRYPQDDRDGMNVMA